MWEMQCVNGSASWTSWTNQLDEPAWRTRWTNQRDEPAGRTSWTHQLDRPAGRTSWTDQLDGPAWRTSRTDQLDWPAGRISWMDQFFLFEALTSLHIRRLMFQFVHCCSFRVRRSPSFYVLVTLYRVTPWLFIWSNRNCFTRNKFSKGICLSVHILIIV